MRIILLGDQAEAGKWLPIGKRVARALLEAGGGTRTLKPASGVTIKAQVIGGIPKVWIEAGGMGYITVGDGQPFALSGLYSGKFGPGMVGKRADPYTFDSGDFSRTVHGQYVGESLLYAGGNSFISGPKPDLFIYPGQYAVVTVRGNKPTYRLLPFAGTFLSGVLYGGKSATGAHRYESFGTKPYPIAETVSPSFTWSSTVEAPAYTSTDVGAIGAVVTFSGAPDTSETPTGRQPPVQTAYQSVDHFEGTDADNIPTMLNYTGETALIGGVVHSLATFTPSAISSLWTQLDQAANYTMAAVQRTFAASAEAYTVTQIIEPGDPPKIEETATVAFKFDLRFKTWSYTLLSGPEIYEDLVWGVRGSGNNIITRYSGGDTLIEYQITPNYVWVSTSKINPCAAARLSGGRIAILTTAGQNNPKIDPADTSNSGSVSTEDGAIIGKFFSNTITIVSNDGGNSWNARLTPVAIGAFGPIVYAGGDSILAFGDSTDTSDYAVWRSDDGGVSYSQVYNALEDYPQSFPVCLAPGVVGFYSFNTSMYGGYSRFYRTTDYGATWAVYEIPNAVLERPYNKFIGRIAILRAGKSTAGDQYKSVTLAIVVEMPPTVDSEGVTSQVSKVIVSSDGGETWRRDATIAAADVVGVDIGPLNTGLPPNPGIPDMYVTAP